ncbi:hypothetical protein BGZ75_007076 [Mortierella antarctica]|nr:hypothetical protein BGZ75_007076 [Mortierella antarctica]
MKLFRLDFGIKDRYRRGLADTSSRMHRSPQSETDPRHLAASSSSPSALFSAIASTSHARDEPMEQWNQFGSSALEAANAQPQAHRSHSRGSNGGGRGHHGQDYGYDDDQEDDHSNDGYMSSSSSSSLSSGSLASCSSLSPSSSDDDDDDYGDEDDDMQGGGGGGGGVGSSPGGADSYSGDPYDTQENDLPGSNGKHARQRVHFDYYGGQRVLNEHGGLLPAAPIPAIVPLSDREALEQEARRRRLERHADKRRKSLNGSQAPPEDLTKPALADPLVLELIREEAEKERRQQPDEDEEEDDEEEDGEGDDDEDDDDEDKDGDDEESDEDEPDYDGRSSDDGHSLSSMDESDNDRDSDDYDFYRGYNQYPPQDRDYSGDEEDKEEEDAGVAIDWYPQYGHGAEADATLLSVDDLHCERLHRLAQPGGTCRRIECSPHSPMFMDSEDMDSKPAHAFAASPVFEDPSSYHMLPAVIAHYWKKLTHPSDTLPMTVGPSSSSTLSPASSRPPAEQP